MYAASCSAPENTRDCDPERPFYLRGSGLSGEKYAKQVERNSHAGNRKIRKAAAVPLYQAEKNGPHKNTSARKNITVLARMVGGERFELPTCWV